MMNIIQENNLNVFQFSVRLVCILLFYNSFIIQKRELKKSKNLLIYLEIGNELIVIKKKTKYVYRFS